MHGGGSGGAFEQLVQEIRREMGAHGLMDREINLPRLEQLMSQFNPERDVEGWRKYCFGDALRYTRNLVDDGNGKYNLLLLCWQPTQCSPVHDHAGSHCLLKVMHGRLQETRYEWPSTGGKHAAPVTSLQQEQLQLTRQFEMQAGEVAYMHDTLGLHCVGNPAPVDGGEMAVSLHLYSPPIDTCRTYCVATGQARTGGRCVFYSTKGTR